MFFLIFLESGQADFPTFPTYQTEQWPTPTREWPSPHFRPTFPTPTKEWPYIPTTDTSYTPSYIPPSEPSEFPSVTPSSKPPLSKTMILVISLITGSVLVIICVIGGILLYKKYHRRHSEMVSFPSLID